MAKSLHAGLFVAWKTSTAGCTVAIHVASAAYNAVSSTFIAALFPASTVPRVATFELLNAATTTAMEST